MNTILLHCTEQIKTYISDTSQKVAGFGRKVDDKPPPTTKSQCSLEQNYSRMKKSLLYILMLLISFICTLTATVQNLGITTQGTTGYPQTNIGNTLTESGDNSGNFLIFNPVTTTIPLTSIIYRTRAGTIPNTCKRQQRM